MAAQPLLIEGCGTGYGPASLDVGPTCAGTLLLEELGLYQSADEVLSWLAALLSAVVPYASSAAAISFSFAA